MARNKIKQADLGPKEFANPPTAAHHTHNEFSRENHSD
jgi:hypothetical protein